MVTRHPLPGSERKVAQGATVIGNCDPAERIEVFVMLRRQQQAQFDALMKRIEAGDASVKPLSREALAQDYGAAPADIAKVRAFAAAHGLTVAREDPAARSVLLSGTIAQFQSAFEVKLERYQHHTAGQFRGRTGTISVPDDLHGVVEAVLGLDNRPQARPHFRIRPPFVRRARSRCRSRRRSSRRSTSFRKATAAVSASASSSSAAVTTRRI